MDERDVTQNRETKREEPWPRSFASPARRSSETLETLIATRGLPPQRRKTITATAVFIVEDGLRGVDRQRPSLRSLRRRPSGAARLAGIRSSESRRGYEGADALPGCRRPTASAAARPAGAEPGDVSRFARRDNPQAPPAPTPPADGDLHTISTKPRETLKGRKAHSGVCRFPLLPPAR